MSIEALIVYPHALIALAIRNVLDYHGLTPTHCCSVGEAYDALKSRSFRLCLIDLSIPGAVGDVLPAEAKARGVEEVWAIANVHNQKAYRRKPQRLYGADNYIELPDFSTTLGKHLQALGWRSKDEASHPPKSDEQEFHCRVACWLLQNASRVEQWSELALAKEIEVYFAQDAETKAMWSASEQSRAREYLRRFVQQSGIKDSPRIAI